MMPLEQAFGPLVPKKQSLPPVPPQPVDHVGQVLGLSGTTNITGNQEFCNMILFIAFGIFALFILDSLVKIAIRKGIS